MGCFCPLIFHYISYGVQRIGLRIAKTYRVSITLILKSSVRNTTERERLLKQKNKKKVPDNFLRFFFWVGKMIMWKERKFFSNSGIPSCQLFLLYIFYAPGQKIVELFGHKSKPWVLVFSFCSSSYIPILWTLSGFLECVMVLTSLDLELSGVSWNIHLQKINSDPDKDQQICLIPP